MVAASWPSRSPSLPSCFSLVSAGFPYFFSYTSILVLLRDPTPFVRPDWVVDSIRAERLLPVSTPLSNPLLSVATVICHPLCQPTLSLIPPAGPGLPAAHPAGPARATEALRHGQAQATDRLGGGDGPPHRHCCSGLCAPLPAATHSAA